MEDSDDTRSPQQGVGSVRLYSEIEESAVSTTLVLSQERGESPTKRAHCSVMSFVEMVSDFPREIWCLVLLKLHPPVFRKVLGIMPKNLRDIVVEDSSSPPFLEKYYDHWKYEGDYFFNFFEKQIGYPRTVRRHRDVKSKFRNVWHGGCNFLELPSHHICVLPTDIWDHPHFQTLTKIVLFRNQLTALPKGIGQLKKLRSLALNNNKLTELPKEIGELENLETINLSWNQLTELPKEICILKNLVFLSLCDNRLTELPKEIGQLKKLKKLLIGQNQLTDLPDQIGELTNLLLIEISNNCFTDLLADLKKLRVQWPFGQIYLDYGQEQSLGLENPNSNYTIEMWQLFECFVLEID